MYIILPSITRTTFFNYYLRNNEGQFKRFPDKLSPEGSSYRDSTVCGLSFSRSQPDCEGFLRAVPFPPSSCAVVHTLVVFRGLAPSWLQSSFDPTSSSCVLRNAVSDCEKGRLAGQILPTAQSEPIAIIIEIATATLATSTAVENSK